jgi:ankyrin repeat protein
LDNLIKKDPDAYVLDIRSEISLFNTPMSNGRTLLYVACQEGKTEIISFLLKKGLDPSIRSRVKF